MTPSEISSAFDALDDELYREGCSANLLVAGGAVMALHLGARASTRDVDAVAISTDDRARFDAAVARVSARLRLPTDWLNQRAAGFAVGTTVGPPLHQGRSLTVFSVSLEQLPAMKLSALRDDVDFADMVAIVRKLGGFDREALWRRVEPYLLPGMAEWKRQNYEQAWGQVHGTP